MDNNVVKINLQEVKIGVICHQVNCQGKMETGIAKVISDIFPYTKEEYLKLCNSIPNTMRLGLTQFIKINPELFIANLFGQYYYGKTGQFTIYDAVKNCLTDVKQFLKKKINSKICINCGYIRYNNIKTCPMCNFYKFDNIKSFPCYIPYKMGCSLAGGDWNIVSRLIKDYIPSAIIFKHEK